MSKFSIFQENNLFIGTALAATIPSSSSELSAFVVIGSYVPAPSEASGLSDVLIARRTSRPSKTLNRDHSDTRFWLKKYEIETKYLESEYEIYDELLINYVFKRDISSMDALEYEVELYLEDFSLLKPTWHLYPPVPFF